jgi:hypothetical protein
MKLAMCAAWVPKGVAAARPTRVRLTKDEMQQLMQSGGCKILIFF